MRLVMKNRNTGKNVTSWGIHAFGGRVPASHPQTLPDFCLLPFILAAACSDTKEKKKIHI